MNNEIETDATLTTRLEQIPMGPATIDLGTSDEPCDEEQSIGASDGGDITPTGATTPSLDKIPQRDLPEPDPKRKETYNDTLATTRVYSRVRDREVNAFSISTDRSHAWSALSGVSMSKISVLAVISLPLYESELRSLSFPHYRTSLTMLLLCQI